MKLIFLLIFLLVSNTSFTASFPPGQIESAPVNVAADKTQVTLTITPRAFSATPAPDIYIRGELFISLDGGKTWIASCSAEFSSEFPPSQKNLPLVVSCVDPLAGVARQAKGRFTVVGGTVTITSVKVDVK